MILAAIAAAFLIGCSEPPPPEKKVAEPPPTPVTGRQAFQQTLGMSHAWAADAQPIRVSSMNLTNPKSEEGKAGAWQIVYVSPSRSRQRLYTWSAVELGSDLHKGVFGAPDEAWSQHGQERPFIAAAIKVDTPDALKTAIEHSKEYFKDTKPKPQVNFQLETTSHSPDPAWRVYWGNSVSVAEWSVFIDASTGAYLGR